jgi:hypothetical protein
MPSNLIHIVVCNSLLVYTGQICALDIYHFNSQIGCDQDAKYSTSPHVNDHYSYQRLEKNAICNRTKSTPFCPFFKLPIFDTIHPPLMAHPINPPTLHERIIET